jgi:hypothetical protein
VAYTELAGKLLADFQALEFLLRSYLYGRSDGRHAPLSQSLNDLVRGQQVPENALTDWSTLGQLIERYNRLVQPIGPQQVVDPAIVTLRDALAHGRVWLHDRESVLILRFDKPVKGVVTVAFSQVASEEWLEECLRHVAEQITPVVKAGRAAGLAPNIFGSRQLTK